jgi:signal transduction histidine kinase
MVNEQVTLTSEEWKNTFDSLTDSVTIHNLESNIIYANDSAVKMLNLPNKTEAINYKCYQWYHGTEKHIENCPGCSCSITKKSTVYELFEPYLNRFLEIRVIPRFDTFHKYNGIIHVVRDITEKKQVEKELQNSLVRFRTLFGDSPVAIREEDFSDLKARFDELRKQKVADFRSYLNQHPEEIKYLSSLIKILEINKQCLALIGSMSAKQVIEGSQLNLAVVTTSVIKEEFIALAEGKTKFQSEIPLVNNKGQLKHFDLILSVLPGSEESLSRVLITFLDITDRKNAEESLKQLNEKLEEKVKQRTNELENSNKALEAFSHSISHDLRAPLRAISGFSKILESEYKEKLGSNGGRMIDMVVENTSKMDQLIKGMLTISKISSGEINKQQIDVNAIVGTILQDLVKPEEKGKIFVQQEPLSFCYGDQELIRHVWINLIENAIKYSSKKEKQIILISSKIANEEVIYSIRDNGVGYNPEYGEKLFTLFHRLHSPEDFAGTGIGLAIVELIIRRHGGRVWAEGEEDKGATFYFSLPDASMTVMNIG